MLALPCGTLGKPKPKMAVYNSQAASLVKSATSRFRNALRYHLEKKCREIEVLIDEGSLRELTNIFPRLIDNIFGLNYQNDWGLKTITRSVNCREFSVFRQFLSPEGPIFELIYRLMSDPTIRFDFPIAYLPTQTKKALEEGIIPTIYGNKLQTFPGQILTAVSLINPYNLKVITNWTVPGEALYPTIVDDYLNYFLPTDESSPSPINVSISPRCITPMKTSPQYLTSGRQFRLLRNKNMQSPVKQNDSIRLETWRSEITAQIFAEMWLKQNTHDISGMNLLTPHVQHIVHVHSFKLIEPYQHFYPLQFVEPFVVNLDHMRTVRMFVKHVHYFSNSYTLGSEHVLEDLKRNINSQVIQKKFYSFLQTSVTFWPLDASFRLVLETWLSYIQPWRYLPSKVNQGPFFTNKKDERGLVNSSWQRTGKNAYMLYRITKVYAQPNLALSISAAERNLFEPLSHLSEIRLPTLDETAFTTQFSVNQGMVAAVRQQLIELEKPGFQYIHLFGEEIKCQITELIELINQARQAAQESCIVCDNTKIGFLAKLGRAFSSLVEGGSFGADYAIHDACKIDTYLLTVSEHLTKIFEISSIIPGMVENGEFSNRLLDTNLSITYKDRQPTKPSNINFQGNPDLQPIRSYEIQCFVRWFYQLSTYLNEKYHTQLRRCYHRQDFIGNIYKQLLAAPIIYYKYDKSTFPPARLQKVLPPRVNLRPMAHKQLLGYFTSVCILAIVWGCNPILLIFTLIAAFFVYVLIKAGTKSIINFLWAAPDREMIS